MQFLHTMVRVSDLDASLHFYCDLLGLKEVRRKENEKGRFTLVFLAAPEDEARSERLTAPELELTYNWDPEEYTGAVISAIWPTESTTFTPFARNFRITASPSTVRPATATWRL